MNQKYPETGYKLCKFYENRARDTPLQGIYIRHFNQISEKIQFWESYTLIVALMGVKFGTEEGTEREDEARDLSQSVQHVAPAGQKNSKSASE